MTVWDEFRRMQDQMDRLIEGRYLEGPGTRQPVMDLYETDDEIVTELEIPGAEKEDIDVHVTGQGIEVSVEKETEVEDNSDDQYRYERRSHSFHRHIPLPDHADASDIDATYKNGILTLRVAKKETSERKRIDVK